MNSTSAALTSFGRSCWVQWPQPGSIWILRRPGTKVFRFASNWSVPGKDDHEVAIARDVERRHRHLQAGHRARDFPVAIDVAVVVERAAEAAAPKLLAVKVDVAFFQPGWQGFGCAGSLQKAAALRHHAEVQCGPAGGCGRAGRGHAIAGRPEQHVANGRARIAPQFRFRGALLLEIELIELRILGARHQAGRRRLAARPERHAERCHRPEAVGPHQRCLPGDAGAPIMPDDDGGRRTQRIKDADHVADEMQDRVLVDRLRRVTLAVAAHIGGDNTEAGGSKRVDLVPPREPGLQENRAPAAPAAPRPARRC